MVNIEIVYIPEAPAAAFIQKLALADGATVTSALAQSDLYQQYPESIHLSTGIFSKQVSGDELLKSGDRIEIYRPLRLDPKEKRRHRAKEQKKKI